MVIRFWNWEKWTHTQDTSNHVCSTHQRGIWKQSEPGQMTWIPTLWREGLCVHVSVWGCLQGSTDPAARCSFPLTVNRPSKPSSQGGLRCMTRCPCPPYAPFPRTTLSDPVTLTSHHMATGLRLPGAACSLILRCTCSADSAEWIKLNPAPPQSLPQWRSIYPICSLLLDFITTNKTLPDSLTHSLVGFPSYCLRKSISIIIKYWNPCSCSVWSYWSCLLRNRTFTWQHLDFKTSPSGIREATVSSAHCILEHALSPRAAVTWTSNHSTPISKAWANNCTTASIIHITSPMFLVRWP